MKPGESGDGAPKLSIWARLVPWIGVFGYLLTPVNLIVALRWGKSDVLDWIDMVWTFGLFGTPFAIGLLFTPVARPSDRKFRLGLVIGVATCLGPLVLAQVFPLWRDMKVGP